MDGLSKDKYIGVVKFTLNSMMELAKEDRNYNLNADLIHYYETTIKTEGVITTQEFLDLCKETGIK